MNNRLVYPQAVANVECSGQVYEQATENAAMSVVRVFGTNGGLN